MPAVPAAASDRAPRGPEADGWEQLWIGGGRRAGLRPGDLVGAIANEAGVPGSVVGAIQLFDDFALVDVQGEVADAVEHALRNATIRGQRAAGPPRASARPPLRLARVASAAQQLVDRGEVVGQDRGIADERGDLGRIGQDPGRRGLAPAARCWP